MTALPGSGIIRNVILDTIGGMMVLPNKWPITLSDQIPTKLVTASQPKVSPPAGDSGSTQYSHDYIS